MKLCVVLLLFLAMSESASYAQDYFASLIAPKKNQSSLKGLMFKEAALEIKEQGEGDKKSHYVEVSGRYINSEWALIADTDRVKTSPDGNFVIKVPVIGQMNGLEMIAVGPLGEIEKQKIGIFVPQYEELKKQNWTNLKSTRKEKNLKITPGIGLSVLSYNEPSRAAISETFITGKLSADYLIGESRFSLGSNLYSSLAVLSHSTESYVYFFGTNLRGGYRLPYLKDPWQLKIFVGYYFTTTFGGTDDFGYSNLQGPQIYPTLSYKFKNDGALSSYVKYSPVANGIGFYTFDNSEFATGAAYFFRPQSSGIFSGKSLGLTADLAWLNLKTTIGKVSFQTTTLGAALRF